MTKSTFTLCCACCALLAFASPVFADTYRWVDANGVVNYAEQKPRGVPQEQVTVIEAGQSRRSRAFATAQPSPPAPAPQTAPTGNDNATLSERQQDMLRSLEEAEATRQQQIAEIRRDNCARSRQVLANLSAKSRIRVRDQDGNERMMPEEERQEKIKDAQTGIVEYCDA